MRILVVDVGGSHVKLVVTGTEPRKFDSGDGFTPQQLIAGIKASAADWTYDVATIGIPSPVLRGAVMEEPWNLGRGWVGFDYEGAFGVPMRIVNDAAMQALGSDEGGRMLFLGLGSGLGTALVDEGRVVPLELAHFALPRQDLRGLLGRRGLDELGEDEWKRSSWTARSCCAPRSPPSMSCSAAATCGCSTTCRTASGAAATTRPSKAASAPGIGRRPRRAGDSP